MDRRKNRSIQISFAKAGWNHRVVQTTHTKRNLPHPVAPMGPGRTQSFQKLCSKTLQLTDCGKKQSFQISFAKAGWNHRVAQIAHTERNLPRPVAPMGPGRTQSFQKLCSKTQQLMDRGKTLIDALAKAS